MSFFEKPPRGIYDELKRGVPADLYGDIEIGDRKDLKGSLQIITEMSVKHLVETHDIDAGILNEQNKWAELLMENANNGCKQCKILGENYVLYLTTDDLGRGSKKSLKRRKAKKSLKKRKVKKSLKRRKVKKSLKRRKVKKSLKKRKTKKGGR